MLSAVIITKNEEDNIENCIKSLLDLADEIIVLDSKSKDKTLETINNFKSSKIKVFEVDWKGFAKTKNQGIDLATGPWILSIDADEVISKDLQVEITKAILSPSVDGYYISRLLYFCNKPVRYGGVYPDHQMRLFRKSCGRFEDVPVHEGVIIHGKKEYLKGIMHHYSYKSIFDYFQRFNSYTDLDARKKQLRGQKFSVYKLIALPWGLFNRLFLRLGILDGIPGIFYHIFSSLSPVVKYAKLWELSNK
jgi:glycosyltransferase involved in cell wall biosynthesis